MIEKNNTWKILEFFFYYPTTEIHLRELARRMKLSMPAIIFAVEKLARENFIIIKKNKVTTVLKANLDSVQFIKLKKSNNLEKILFSGILDMFKQKLHYPKTIICFGSYSRGEDIESSDIDIAIIGCNETEINLKKIEKKKIFYNF